MKILVGILGRDPGSYYEVTWRIQDSTIRAKMPLEALAEHLQVDHVIVFVPDSLGKGETYADVRQSAEGLVRTYQPSWHPVVLPSRYSSVVLGDPGDFYQAAMLELSRWLAEHLPPPVPDVKKDPPVELFLETSTGLNVFQVFAYRAIQILAGALAFVRDVDVRVYNADPVQKESQEVEIFLTEEHRKFRSTLPRFHVPSTPRLAGTYRDHPHPGQDPEYQKIRDELKRLWSGDEVAAFLNAVYHGIPLGIIHEFHPEPEKILQTLQTLFQYIIAQIRRNEAGVWIRPVSLGPDVVPYALGALLSRELQARWPYFTASLKDSGATYDQLRTLMEHVYRHHPVILNRFLAERSIQPERISCLQFPSLLARCMEGSGNCDGKIDMRNFFAHAGFERCAVEVLKDPEGHIRFRYAEQHLETIRKWLS